MSADEKIRAAVAPVIGSDSPLLSATVDVLQDQLLAAREAGADVAERKFLASLGTASVVTALALAAKPKKKAKLMGSQPQPPALPTVEGQQS